MIGRKAQLQPIGLDIGRDSIKMLQVEVVGQGLAVKAAACRAFTDEVKAQPQLRIALAGDIVRQMLREGQFHGRTVVVAMPREMVYVKNFRLPPMPAGELESAIHFEARSLFPFSMDEAKLEFLPVGEVRQGNDVLQEIIAIAVRNEDVDNFIEQVHRCGVVVDSIDIEPCALFRGIERFVRRREDEQEVHCLLDIGYGGSQVVIGRGREISFLKNIDIGATQFHQAIARSLGITIPEAQALRRRLLEQHEPENSADKRDPVRQAVFDAIRSTIEQLGRELSLCLRYQSVTFRGHRPARVRLLGGEAEDGDLQAALNSIVTIPVEAGNPLFSMDTSRMKEGQSPARMSQWALALGLSLRHTAGRFAPRDGKPRDPIAMKVDMAAAVAAGEATAANPGAEVVHA